MYRAPEARPEEGGLVVCVDGMGISPPSCLYFAHLVNNLKGLVPLCLGNKIKKLQFFLD